MVLLPQFPLVKMILFSQVVNGVLLPFVLIFMILLVNKESIMKEWTQLADLQPDRVGERGDHDRADSGAGGRHAARFAGALRRAGPTSSSTWKPASNTWAAAYRAGTSLLDNGQSERLEWFRAIQRTLEKWLKA